MSGRPRGCRGCGSRAGQWLAAAALAFGVSAECLASPDLSSATRRLGSPEFVERHQAGDLLLKAGPSAIPYLREAAESASPEIRFRASDILERIELRVLDAQKGDILAGSMPTGLLPAWDRYLQIVTDTPSARRLFIAMLDRSPQLLLSMGTPAFSEEFDRMASEWANSSSPWLRGKNPDGPEILAAILFAACQPEAAPSPMQAQLISQSAEYPWFSQQVLGSERSDALKSILVTWILQTARSPAGPRLHLAQHYKFPEGVIPAREILENKGGGLETQNALIYLSVFGQEQDVPLIETFLNSDTELHNFQSNRTNEAMKTQVRDVALAALWRLRRENPASHGLKNYLEHNGFPRPGSIGFQSDEQRRQAIHHWREWRKRNVKADLPPDGWAIEGWRG